MTYNGYRIVDLAALQRRADDHSDPRYRYYDAMLNSTTYDEYVAKIKGEVPVFPSTVKNGKKAIWPRAEFKYALEDCGWIATTELPTTEEEYRLDLERRVAEAQRRSPEERRRRLAEAPKRPDRRIVSTTVFVRNEDVIAEVLARANGVCERCYQPAPFIRRAKGTPFLEVHHIVQLADEGEDTVANAIAVCPNCHRQAHYG